LRAGHGRLKLCRKPHERDNREGRGRLNGKIWWAPGEKNERKKTQWCAFYKDIQEHLGKGGEPTVSKTR